jgi:hypothetical protein
MTGHRPHRLALVFAVPVSSLDGKEETVGSSPVEGFKGPANRQIVLPG